MAQHKIFVPRDTTSCALGAESLAERLGQLIAVDGLPLQLVRNGSRGLYWLEPLLEIDDGESRWAYGPLCESKLEELVAARFWENPGAHPSCLGKTEDIPYLRDQQRITFARVGVIDPLSVAAYREAGGFRGLDKALTMQAADIVAEIRDSGLRGRGGAAFPTGIKWQTVLDTPAPQKYVVCNADEGDSGTYSDRMLMEGDPMALIEGMIIAGLAVGADRGYIYLREEYPLTRLLLDEALEAARREGYLGERICDSDHDFEIELRLGAGAYICGEETAMLESLEGKRGEVRAKPPLPAVAGLFAQPSIINNVISLASVPGILADGAVEYQAYGVGRSRGTLPFQLAGNLRQAGLVELAFGNTLRSLLEDFGAGSRSGRPLRAVQVGGPLGAYLPESQWDTPLDYEAFQAIGAMLGHGGIVAFDDTVDMSLQARFSMEFCALESCGKCTPCRIGSTRGVELIDRIRDGREIEQNTALLLELCDTMEHGSLCAMGGLTPYPVRSAVRYFSADFEPGAGNT